MPTSNKSRSEGNLPRRNLPPDERRLQLLELGLRLFGKRSYDDVSIDDIARELGISRGLMYHYFGSKRVFYTEVVRHAADVLRDSISPSPDLDGLENVRRGLRAYFTFVADRGDAYLALMHGGLGVDDQVHAILEETRGSIVQGILERLGVTQPCPPLRISVRSWIGGVEAAALDWLARRDVEPEVLVDVLTSALMIEIAVASRRAGQLAPLLALRPSLPSLRTLLGW